MTEHISDFIDFMRSAGIGPHDASDIIDDDKKRRYRLEGDRAGVKNGSYALRVEPDGFAFGWALSFKEGHTHSWHAKASRKISPEERAAFKAKAAAAKKEREEQTARDHEAAAARAAKIWDRCEKTGSTAYLERKKVELNGARIMGGETVVVPLRKDGKLTGLQFIKPDGSKIFNKGIEKEGSYFSIAKKGDDLSRIYICEGFATGGSIRAAMGQPVIIAFDAGNLKPVAKAIAKKYPDADIVIAADNDQWTKKPDGTEWNPGVEKAQQAAVAIGGARVVIPSVPHDDEARRTDWNDIAVTDGLDALRQAFTQPVYDRPDDMPDYDYPDYGEPVVADDPLEHIWPLGHNRGTYYFFPRAAGQIVSLTATSMGKMQNLYMLAERGFWEMHYSDGKTADSNICALASAHLMAACHRKGIFEIETTRGVGAWIDDGKVVINAGDEVIADGRTFRPSDFRGEAVYESGPRVINLTQDALGNAAASKLREACRMLCWRRGLYADLLAGWLVVAPVGSALKWRPHIWITGRSGSGKSTILDEIITPVLGSVAIRRDGGTTEAGVRKALGCSGRPFILDEAESETAQDRMQMERIIFLARRSSSGGVVENFNASFQARSCFCFSAINPRVEQNADKGRITQLELVADTSPNREENFSKLLSFIHETFTPEYSKAMLSRTVQNMDALLANVKTFSLAASAVMGNKRNGDQIGPLLAGAYMLTSTGTISFEDARDWMKRQDWHWSTMGEDESDSFKLLTHIMTSRCSYDSSGVRRESSIGDMIDRVASGDEIDANTAQAGLRGYGIKVEDGRIFFANQSPPLRKILADTPWIPWARTLSDYPDARAEAKPVYFAPGMTSRCISIPLSAVIDQGAPDDWDNTEIQEEF